MNHLSSKPVSSLYAALENATTSLRVKSSTGGLQAAATAQPPAYRKNALLASARRLIQPATKEKSPIRQRSDSAQWQTEAWDYYDLVGELHFLVNTLAGQLSRAHLYLGYQRNYNEEPERVEDSNLTRILETLGDSRGRLGQLLYRLGVNLYVAGEGWLVGVPARNESGVRPKLSDLEDLDGLEWRVLSTSEVSLKDQGKVQVELDSDEKLELPLSELYLVRIWREHPRRSWEADSAVRSSLPILSELVKLTMHVSAQADSRLAGAGILVVPQSAQNALRPVDEVGTPVEGEDYFTEAMIEAMSTAIQDRAAASAIVPIVATVPDESAGKIEHISFATSLDSEARNLRDEALRRLALSLDAPPEVLLGTSSMNHWGGWLVKEETVSTHLENPLALICDALTTEYLWPILSEMGYEGSDVTRYSICYDIDHLITRPSLSGDAKDLYAAGAISEETLRRATGFDESDAPEKPMSLARATALRMVEKEPSLIFAPGIAVLVEQLSGLIAGEELGAPAPLNPATPATAGTSSEPSPSPAPAGGLPDTAPDEPEVF